MNFYCFVFILFALNILNYVISEKNLPVLMWHSAGETCCGEEFIEYSKLIQNQFEDEVYIKSVQLGSTNRSDRVSSLTTHPYEQVRIVCEMLNDDENFADGFHGVGFSQGALLLRALAQICPFPTMKNLISLGGPQQGFYKYPRCGEVYGPKCAKLHFYITTLAYRSASQLHFTPATYFHDVNEERYRKGSTFLADINNENEINYEYIDNLKSLKKFVLVMYEDDVGVFPKESTWFGYIDKDSNTIPLEQLELYKEDRLGLKSMKESGKLIFLTSPLGHLKLDENWFIDNIVPLLKEK